MCIDAPVGENAKNNTLDVKTIQILLNINASRLSDTKTKMVTGRMNKETIAWIALAQKELSGESQPRTTISPDDDIIDVLLDGIAPGLNRDRLRLIMPNARSGSIDVYFPLLLSAMPNYDISTPLRTAHFLAQLGHESLDFFYAEESASGSAYEGRKDLGNTKPGDGVKFKGRGLIQVTGRANYTAYGEEVDDDFVTGQNYRRIASDPAVAVDVSCWYWKTRKLNELADKNDVRAVTKAINGGFNGLDDRVARTKRARYFLIEDATWS